MLVLLGGGDPGEGVISGRPDGLLQVSADAYGTQKTCRETVLKHVLGM